MCLTDRFSSRLANARLYSASSWPSGKVFAPNPRKVSFGFSWQECLLQIGGSSSGPERRRRTTWWIAGRDSRRRCTPRERNKELELQHCSLQFYQCKYDTNSVTHQKYTHSANRFFLTNLQLTSFFNTFPVINKDRRSKQWWQLWYAGHGVFFSFWMQPRDPRVPRGESFNFSEKLPIWSRLHNKCTVSNMQ